ncbi:MAG TPA: sigma-70 family RNA polymerase sigma factor [Blastocatellia bacterium]
MATHESKEVTQLLIAWKNGDPAALEQLIPLVQAELHRLAQHYMRQERAAHPLQPTALVNEAYIRLIEWQNVKWQNRAHFFGVSAQLMRRILVDLARRRQRVSGKSVHQVSLRQAEGLKKERTADLMALDDALRSLAEIDERKSRIVELRYFGGLGNEEIAEVLGISANTVIREWGRAKAWLYRELKKTTHDSHHDTLP